MGVGRWMRFKVVTAKRSKTLCERERKVNASMRSTAIKRSEKGISQRAANRFIESLMAERLSAKDPYWERATALFEHRFEIARKELAKTLALNQLGIKTTPKDPKKIERIFSLLEELDSRYKSIEGLLPSSEGEAGHKEALSRKLSKDRMFQEIWDETASEVGGEANLRKFNSLVSKHSEVVDARFTQAIAEWKKKHKF